MRVTKVGRMGVAVAMGRGGKGALRRLPSLFQTYAGLGTYEGSLGWSFSKPVAC